MPSAGSSSIPQTREQRKTQPRCIQASLYSLPGGVHTWRDRNFGYRLKEHKNDAQAVCDKKVYTRGGRKVSEIEFNRSAVTDHVAKHYHVINSDEANIVRVDREGKAGTRRIGSGSVSTSQPGPSSMVACPRERGVGHASMPRTMWTTTFAPWMLKTLSMHGMWMIAAVTPVTKTELNLHPQIKDEP